ncbi:probable serine/threonine-protein kinase ifkA isoform X2 [Patiria miniata]|uniref:Glutamate-rich protein 2 n=1 Tax=Patiria miniata TaxID=46514 RepID=A0A914BS35_PATMI|nr:probable serine/threonine-protein kinase ifkA isoform X2 [Patiria miniata]
MQNQNNNNTMISRQSGSRSGTPNSMVVLEQGRDSPTRPPSGRRSVNRRSPLKRGGSSLEILPAEEDDSSRTPSRLSNTGANTDSQRQTQSAGSVSRLSFTEDELGNGDGKGGGVGLKRSSSIDRRAEVITPDSPRKQVYLTTVKRNFEQHGMPKNEELAKAVQNLPSLQNGAISNSPSSTHKTHDSSHRKQHGERSDRLETDAENNDLKQPGDVEKGLERLTLGEAGGHGSDVKGHDDEMNNTGSYYISHGSTSNSSKASVSSSAENDSYYLTHDRATSSATSETAQTATDKTEEPTTQTDQETGTTSSSKVTEEADDENESNDDDDDDEEEDNEEDEEGKAPFQLLGEFLEAVMEEDYENAEKLCKMVLLYEPENAEAKQFQPLIEEMLKREREAQLWGSESEDEDDDADDDDDNSDDGDDDDDSDDEDSDEDEDDEESSSEEEEDEANEDKSDTHVEK